MKVEKSVEEKLYCDKCGKKLPNNWSEPHKMTNFAFQSEKGEGIRVTLVFETEWGYRYGRGKSRGSWHTEHKPSDMCKACRKKILKGVHDHIETILRNS
jgi:hypothetical protein